MLKVLFTLDYEIHGNGEGCSHQLMLEPTARMLRLFDEFGAKLTIMADIAEILKFKDFAERLGRDEYHYNSIVNQLQAAVRTGHDVQLHIHSSYFNASHDGQRWVQDWSEYNFAGLRPERLDEMVRVGKEFLESTLQPVCPSYRCSVFRAANWSVSPSKNVVEALLANGISIDTSVFKYGRRNGMVSFDYSSAHSDMLPWRARRDAIWAEDPRSRLWEVPIYSENRWLPAFVTPNRVYRVISSRTRRVVPIYPAEPSTSAAKEPSGLLSRFGLCTKRHAWKADFNQCTGRQLIRALARAEKRYSLSKEPLPFVLIGHSKLFTRMNERSLRPFLAHVVRHPNRFGFGTFGALGLGN
jgi:hypothetical protein